MQEINSKNKILKRDVKKSVMDKIKTQEVKMLPRWYFLFGSVLSAVSLVGLIISVIFLINLTVFFIKKQGYGYGRLDLILNNFPIWVPILAVLGIILGLWLLKKYDFSYKKNFVLIAMLFVVSLIIAALIMEKTGLNETWSKTGPMRRFYRQYEDSKLEYPKGPGSRYMLHYKTKL